MLDINNNIFFYHYQHNFLDVVDDSSNEQKEGLLTIQPDEIKCVTFTFMPSSADVGSSIEVGCCRGVGC